MRKLLTTKFMEGLKPGPKPQQISDLGVRNLRFIVHPSGRKVLVWHGRVNGQPKTTTLGIFPVMGLADARKIVGELNDAKAIGDYSGFAARGVKGDGIEAPVDPRAGLTCDWLFDRYMEGEGGTRKSADEKRKAYNREIKPIIGDRHIDTIEYEDLAGIIQAKFDAGYPIASNRLKALIGRWWRWAVTRGRAQSGLKINPAADLVTLADERRRKRFLNAYEIGLFFRALPEVEETFGEALTLILYTGLRRGESFGLMWSEVDFSDGTLLIKGERVKNGVDLLLPLPGSILKLLQERKRRTGSYQYVWPATRSWSDVEDDDEDFLDSSKTVKVWNKPMRALNEKCVKLASEDKKPFERFTIHDLRRTVSTGMRGLRGADHRSLVPNDIVERVLNHVIGGVRANYDYHDYFAEKKDALDAWATNLDRIRSDSNDA